MTATESPTTVLSHEERVELVLGHQAMAFWIARRICRRYPEKISPDDIEDVANTVLVEFWRVSATFDPSRGMTFGTYALRFCRFAAIRHRVLDLRGGVHVPQHLERDVPISTPLSLGAGDPDNRAFDVADHREPATTDEAEAVMAALERAGVPDIYLRALRMRFIEGMSARAVNRAFGKSHGWFGMAMRSVRRVVAKKLPNLADALT